MESFIARRPDRAACSTSRRPSWPTSWSAASSRPGRDRLTAAGLRGVPQVISLGALDMVNFGPPETVPEKFKGRRFYQHNPTVTLMRTTPEENDRLGKEIAQKASAAKRADGGAGAAARRVGHRRAKASRSGGRRPTRPCSRACATG